MAEYEDDFDYAEDSPEKSKPIINAKSSSKPQLKSNASLAGEKNPYNANPFNKKETASKAKQNVTVDVDESYDEDGDFGPSKPLASNKSNFQKYESATSKAQK